MLKVKIREMARIGAGQGAPQNPSSFSSDGVPFIRAGSLDFLINGGNINSLEKINKASASRNRMKLYPQGTIIFAKSGMSATKNLVYILPAPAYVVSHLATLETKPTIDAVYLRFFWEHFQPSNLIQDPAYPSISLETISNVEIEVPPLPEQKRIAATLGKADRLRRLRRYARELSDTYLQSVFLEMFGDPTTNRKGWPQDCLSNLCEPGNGIKAGPFGSSLKKESYSDKGVRVYGQEQVIGGDFTIGNYYITYAMFNDFKAYQVKPGDVLISLVGSFGKVAVVPEGIEPGIINPRLLKISPNPQKIKSIFLAHCFENPATQMNLLHISHGGTMGILNAGLLRVLKMIVPPIYIQEQFVRIVQKFERLQSQQREAERQAEHLFQTLLCRAFRGELS